MLSLLVALPYGLITIVLVTATIDCRITNIFCNCRSCRWNEFYKPYGTGPDVEIWGRLDDDMV